LIRITSGFSSVDLRSPDLGDENTLDLNMLINKTMNGTIKTYKGARPTFFRQTVSSTLNNRTNAEAFTQFMVGHCGEEVNFKYYREAVLVTSIDGFILTPVAEIITQKDECSYNISFEFEYDSIGYLMEDKVCP